MKFGLLEVASVVLISLTCEHMICILSHGFTSAKLDLIFCLGKGFTHTPANPSFLNAQRTVPAESQREFKDS